MDSGGMGCVANRGFHSASDARPWARSRTGGPDALS